MVRTDDPSVIAAYEAWDPATETVDELCARLDISKPTLYAVLKRNDVEPRQRRRIPKVRPDGDGNIAVGDPALGRLFEGDQLLQVMAQNALRVLVDEVKRLSREVDELREQLKDQPLG
jgi:hypothetical protein